MTRRQGTEALEVHLKLDLQEPRKLQLKRDRMENVV